MTPAAILCRLLWRVGIFEQPSQKPLCTTCTPLYKEQHIDVSEFGMSSVRVLALFL